MGPGELGKQMPGVSYGFGAGEKGSGLGGRGRRSLGVRGDPTRVVGRETQLGVGEGAGGGPGARGERVPGVEMRRELSRRGRRGAPGAARRP